MMSADVREAAVAGRFYPGSIGRLTAFMEEHLVPAVANAVAPRALIVPHAGYTFSGLTAARAFSLVPPGRYRRAIVLGPSHYVDFRGLAMAPHAAFRTPLGDARVDTAATQALAAGGDHRFTLQAAPHREEHSLEVEIPFLQYLDDELAIVPIACGQMMLQDVEDAAVRLLPLWDEETLLVVSSDFTHYGDHFGYYPFPAAEARARLPKLDGGAIDQIRQLDAEGFLTYVERTGATICGRFPIAVLLAAAKASGTIREVELIDYTTSGEVTGDYRSSVSYAAIALRN